MIYCETPVLEEWIARPQEDFPRPTWTKLIANGLVLSNSIEYADWDAVPVEPMVCELCWAPGCARAGLARIVRLPRQLLWTRPNLGDIDEFWRDPLGEAQFIRDDVLIPERAWMGLHERVPLLPAANHFPRATRRHLAALWLSEMPAAVRVTDLDALGDRVWETALASDPLDLEPTREITRQLCAWLREAPDEPLSGCIVPATTSNGINRIYFDGLPLPEWPAFALGPPNSPAFGRDLVYEPVAGEI